MTDATSPDTERAHAMSPDWQRTIAEMARTDPKLRFTTLAHHLTPSTLRAAYKRLNRSASPGPDGMTVEAYGEALGDRLHVLWQRLKTGRYRASPARRVYIPKPNGKQRPLGIANVEDRVVQTALAMVLEPIYEQDFLNFSYGFRPKRSAKDALEFLRRTIDRRPIRVVVEADIKGFFDNLDHAWLRKFLAHRVADRGLLRVINKILKSGVVEDGVVTREPSGAPQGGPLSPLLANVYLHYVLDLWFDRQFRPRCAGEAYIVRYADDFVMCFEHREDAERLCRDLAQRLAAFGLSLEPDKTRLIEFGTDLERRGPGPKSGRQTFDFLGFTHYMRRRPKRDVLRTARKPAAKSRRRFLAEVRTWLRRNMHRPPWVHQRVLAAKLRGFFNYFGLRYCRLALVHVRREVNWAWFKVLRRRSQKARRLTWTGWKRKPWSTLPQVKRRKKRAKRCASQAPKRVIPPVRAQLALFPATP